MSFLAINGLTSQQKSEASSNAATALDDYERYMRSARRHCQEDPSGQSCASWAEYSTSALARARFWAVVRDQDLAGARQLDMEEAVGRGQPYLGLPASTWQRVVFASAQNQVTGELGGAVKPFAKRGLYVDPATTAGQANLAETQRRLEDLQRRLAAERLNPYLVAPVAQAGLSTFEKVALGLGVFSTGLALVFMVRRR